MSETTCYLYGWRLTGPLCYTVLDYSKSLLSHGLKSCTIVLCQNDSLTCNFETLTSWLTSRRPNSYPWHCRAKMAKHWFPGHFKYSGKKLKDLHFMKFTYRNANFAFAVALSVCATARFVPDTSLHNIKMNGNFLRNYCILTSIRDSGTN